MLSLCRYIFFKKGAREEPFLGFLKNLLTVVPLTDFVGDTGYYFTLNVTMKDPCSGKNHSVCLSNSKKFNVSHENLM